MGRKEKNSLHVIIRRQGEKIVKQDKKIKKLNAGKAALARENEDYQLEHEYLLDTIRDLRSQLAEKEDKIFELETDLKLATRRKVAYRNQLLEAGIKIKSVFSKAYQTNKNTHKSTKQNALVNDSKKNQILQ